MRNIGGGGGGCELGEYVVGYFGGEYFVVCG